MPKKKGAKRYKLGAQSEFLLNEANSLNPFPLQIFTIFKYCELPQNRVFKADIADWICLIRWESNYDTTAVGTLNADGSKDHGLFQISDKYWCTEGEIGGACGLDCKTLRDDEIKDDSVCARRIYRITKERTGNGFSAWAGWTQRCQSQDKQSYIANCNLDS